MDRSDITRVEPAILVDAILVLLEVALHDGGPAGLQAAGRFSITRQLSALVVHDPELDPEHGATGTAGVGYLLVLGHRVPIGWADADGPDGRHLRHSPKVIYPDPAAAQPADRGRRRRGSTNHHHLEFADGGARFFDMLDHSEPHVRHSGRVRDAFLIEQGAQAVRTIVRAHHQLEAGDCRRVGDAPAVRMEHRHDWQHDGTRRHVEDVWSDDRHGVEHRRAMLVEYALRVSRGAAGVAKPARIALVTLDPLVVAVFGFQPAVELAVVTDIMFDRRPPRLHALDQRDECRVVEQHAVFGVVDDEF